MMVTKIVQIVFLTVFVFAPGLCVAGEGMNWIKMRDQIRVDQVGKVAVASSFGPVHKKYIAHGWDLLGMSPREVLANADAWNVAGVDGVTLMINDRLADGRRISHTRIMNDPLCPRRQGMVRPGGNLAALMKR